MMAGDTHDLEYYADPPSSGVAAVHYFVNGGGGAYLSFGTALAMAGQPANRHVGDLSGSAGRRRGRLEARTPWWKRPAWWWTNRFDAWPFSAEWLSALFDYNVAPFFQSFVEVRVEPSAKRVRLLPVRHPRAASMARPFALGPGRVGWRRRSGRVGRADAMTPAPRSGHCCAQKSGEATKTSRRIRESRAKSRVLSAEVLLLPAALDSVSGDFTWPSRVPIRRRPTHSSPSWR